MVLPKLTSANLISIGQLCDDGCSIILDKTNMVAIKNNTIILKGKRNKLDELWDIPIPKKKITANCCVSPTKHGSIYKRKPREVSNVTRNTTSKQYKTTTFPSHLHNLQALAIIMTLIMQSMKNSSFDYKQHHLSLLLFVQA